jgi:DNA-directed RNA polymerase specialized sigma24 family protein
MSSDGSVTVWIGALKAGDPAAPQPLWERYFRQLVRLARARFRDAPRRAADEEDVALSAFDSFCRGAAAGRFPQLCDRDNLWPLLVVITARKVIDARNHEARAKRGGGKVRGESAWLDAVDGSDRDGGINLVIGDEPTPAFAAEVAERTQHLLDALGKEELRKVAVRKMEGYSNAEIAAELGCVERTVERKLDLIRKRWQESGK